MSLSWRTIVRTSSVTFFTNASGASSWANAAEQQSTAPTTRAKNDFINFLQITAAMRCLIATPLFALHVAAPFDRGLPIVDLGTPMLEVSIADVVVLVEGRLLYDLVGW